MGKTDDRDKRAKELAAWLRVNAVLTRAEQAEILGVTRAGLQKAINRLVKAGVYTLPQRAGIVIPE